MHISFEESGEDDFDLWIEQSVKNSAQFKYWHLGLTLILKCLIYVRAIREANIDAYINVLSYWVRWCFLFDHPNYARYTPVHLTDLWNAKWENSSVYRILQNGIFAVNKTNKRFSNIHLDQNHEQLNDYLKKNGGIVGLTEDPAALKRFVVCAPLVGELCKDFEASFMDVHGETSTNKHHAESLYMQQRFLKDNESLLKTISTQGNPFNTSQKEIVNIYNHEQSPSSSLINWNK